MRLMLFAALLVVSFRPADAAQQPLVLDGPVAKAVVAGAASPGIDADEAVPILAAIFGDFAANPNSFVDAKERALLTALAQSKAAFPATINGKSVAIGPLAPEAAQLMQLVFATNNPPPEQLWRDGNEAVVRNFARIHSIENPMLSIMIERGLADDLGRHWRNSSPGNNYDPLRTRLVALHGIYKAASPMVNGAGRKLLMKAMQRLDINNSGAIPDYLFSWLNP